MGLKIRLSRLAEKDLLRLTKLNQQRILQKLGFFEASGCPLNFAKTLTNFGDATHRFWLGNLRLLFCVDELGILILEISQRKNSYK